MKTIRKKSYAARLGVLALALTLVTTCLMGSTMARYTSEITGTGTANIAKWAVAFKHDDVAKTADYAFTLAETKDPNSNVAPAAVAPGDTGKFTVTFDGTGSEVAYEYKIELGTTNFTATTGNVQFYSDSSFNNPWNNSAGFTTVALGDVANAKTVTIYWRWVGGEGNNTNDTTAGVAADDITFTVKLTAQQYIATA